MLTCHIPFLPRFAFANYSSIEDATAARKKLNGKKIDGRAVRLSFADQKITGKEKRIQTVNSKPQHRPKIRGIIILNSILTTIWITTKTSASLYYEKFSSTWN